MQIITTTTLNISEQNLPLLPLVASKLGYKEWKQARLANDPEADVEALTFVQEFLSNDFSERLKNIISPSVDEYFGIVMQSTATAVKEQLDEAITSVTTITE